MIYEDDVKTKGGIVGNKIEVRGEIKFSGTCYEEIQDLDFEAQKKLHKEIKQGMVKGLGDLFYSDARTKLLELHIALTTEMGAIPSGIVEKFAAITDSLKIQPGKAPEPKILERDGKKAVING